MDSEKILNFWFSSSDNLLVNQKKWFMKDEKLDSEIKKSFGSYHKAATDGLLDHWKAQPRAALALVIILDQFSRNLNRNSAQAFACDDKAKTICQSSIDRGHDKILHPIERWFLYMPLMHSEDKKDQELSLRLYESLATSKNIEVEYQAALKGAFKFAKLHANIVFRFGRYPHRNEVLGRESTQEEVDFLKEPNSSF